MSTILNAQGNPARAVEIVHPSREAGRESGAANCDKDDIFEQVVDAALGALTDETTPDHVAEKVYENLIGFLEGRQALLEVQPLLFLTRQQTAHVERLPRRIRIAWKAEYDRGVRQWRKAGGNLSGRRPILPAIPGYDHGEAMKG